jgi:hypothetical protein
MFVNPELPCTSTSYRSAPETLFHESVGVVDTPVAPFAGEASVGADGAATTVVKLLEDHPLGPPSLTALTRQ